MRKIIGCILFLIGIRPLFGIICPNELINAGYVECKSDDVEFKVAFPIPKSWAKSYYYKKHKEKLN